MQEVEGLLHLFLLHLLAAAFGVFSLNLTQVLRRCTSLARQLGPRSLHHYVAAIVLVPQRVNCVDLGFIEVLHVYGRLIVKFDRLHHRRLFADSAQSSFLPFETSHFLLFLDFGLLGCEVGLGEVWRQNLKLSSLGFFEGLWADWESLFHVLGNLIWCHLFVLWRRNSRRDRLPGHLDGFLVWTSRSRSPHLDGSAQKSSTMDLCKLGAVAARMRVDVEGLQVLAVDGSTSGGLGVSIAIGVECRLAEIGGQRGVRKPS